MKTFTLVTALLPLLASALPMNDGKKYEESGMMEHSGKSDYLSNGPFDFTSTYAAYATPDQV